MPAYSQSLPDIIHSYLSSEVDLETTLQRITAPINNLSVTTDENLAANLQSLWRSLLQASKAYPLSSKEQTSLVALLRELRSTPDPSSGNLWSSLTYFEDAVHDIWTEYPASSVAGPAGTGDQGNGWVNMNSFLARITKERIAGLERYAVWVADKALEERQVDDGAGTEMWKLEVLVAAAGVWMVVMGEELWARLGESEIKRERWELWKRRFQFMSRRGGMKISSRELAAEGEAVMQRAA